MNMYDFVVLRRENRQDVEVSLREFEGKVLLVVNTATACGLTPQYEALEAMYRQYKERGFEILDFPCNQFMEQAKQNDEGIQQFCSMKYDTTFPRFKKIDVNGENAAPLYTWLKAQKTTGVTKGKGLMAKLMSLATRANGKSKAMGDIQWNFEKFLVDRKGNVVERYAPVVMPDLIAADIETVL